MLIEYTANETACICFCGTSRTMSNKTESVILCFFFHVWVSAERCWVINSKTCKSSHWDILDVYLGSPDLGYSMTIGLEYNRAWIDIDLKDNGIVLIGTEQLKINLQCLRLGSLCDYIAPSLLMCYACVCVEPSIKWNVAVITVIVICHRAMNNHVDTRRT